MPEQNSWVYAECSCIIIHVRAKFLDTLLQSGWGFSACGICGTRYPKQGNWKLDHPCRRLGGAARVKLQLSACSETSGLSEGSQTPTSGVEPIGAHSRELSALLVTSILGCLCFHNSLAFCDTASKGGETGIGDGSTGATLCVPVTRSILSWLTKERPSSLGLPSIEADMNWKALFVWFLSMHFLYTLRVIYFSFFWMAAAVCIKAVSLSTHFFLFCLVGWLLLN